MSTASVQFIRFGIASRQGSRNLPADMMIGGYSAREEVAVTGTATAGGSRPECPALVDDDDLGYTHVRIQALDGDMIAQVGDDPTASQTAGVLVTVGQEVILPCLAEQLVSLVTRTA